LKGFDEPVSWYGVPVVARWPRRTRQRWPGNSLGRSFSGRVRSSSPDDPCLADHIGESLAGSRLNNQTLKGSDSVVIAKRLESEAEADGVLISDVVR
jgi:hypothetical protein